jgi:RNA polymerase sigma-70 factor (ECF subfamily)
VNQSEAMHLSDQELLEFYGRDHNNEWLGVLFSRYLHLIFGVCMKYFKDENEARDQAQQVCLHVLKILPRHQVTYFKSWLYQVTKNHCLMQLRHASGQRRHPPAPEGAFSEIQEESAVRDKLAQETRYAHLDEAMKQLNEAQRRCVELFYLQRKTYQQVADEAGFTLGEVKSHIQNGKRNLRQAMERMEESARGEGNDGN